MLSTWRTRQHVSMPRTRARKHAKLASTLSTQACKHVSTQAGQLQDVADSNYSGSIFTSSEILLLPFPMLLKQKYPQRFGPTSRKQKMYIFMTYLLLQKFNKVTASIKFKVTECWNGILPTLPIYPLHVSYLMAKIVIIGFYYSEYIALVQATSCKYILVQGRIQSVFGNRVISNGHQFLHCSSHG